MRHLRPRERTAMSLIGQLYEAAQDAALWPAFLDGLAQALGATVTAFVSASLREGRPSLPAGNPLEVVLSRCLDRSRAERGPFFEVVTDRSMPAIPDAAQKSAYEALLRNLKAEHLLAVVFVSAENRLSWLAVLRPGRAGAFDEEEISLLESAAPHIQRALSLHATLAHGRCERTALLEALDGVPAGILLLDRQGRPLVVNRAASEILAAKDGLTLTPEGLAASTAEATRDLRRLISETALADPQSSSSRVFAMPRPSERRSYSVLVKGVSSGRAAPGCRRPSVAVFLTDPDRRVRADEEVLQSLYGFTPAESRVAAELVEGESVEEAARDLDVSLNTARTHMKRLFEKTDTHRHRDLVRLLLCSSCCCRANRHPGRARALPPLPGRGLPPRVAVVPAMS